MALFTRGQVGAANNPAAHSTRTAPTPSDPDQVGDEYGFVSDRSVPVGPRSWRAGSSIGRPENMAPLQDGPTALVGLHESRGTRNLRQNDEDERGHPRGEIGYEDLPETFHNDSAYLPIDPETAPSRPRQGWTGADPARPMWQRRPTFSRPFDQGIAQHPGSTEKVPQDQPRARTSRVLDDLGHGAMPAPGGWFGTLKAGISGQKNTARVTPPSWGETLITEGPASPARRTFR